MTPTEALRSIEVALRLAIRSALDENWIAARGAPNKEDLEERRTEEGKRRDGTVVSHDLIEYTETYHLTNIIEKNWDQFKPIFDDRQRTLVFFGVINDVRNSIAHSRDLVYFEEELISGVAGQLRNQIAIYRSKQLNPSAQHYPLIEKISDNFGQVGQMGGSSDSHTPPMRLEVGDALTFKGTSFNMRPGALVWTLTKVRGFGNTASRVVAYGNSVQFTEVLTDDDVCEGLYISITIRTESKYARYNTSLYYNTVVTSLDDERGFRYSVNPPND